MLALFGAYAKFTFYKICTPNDDGIVKMLLIFRVKDGYFLPQTLHIIHNAR